MSCTVSNLYIICFGLWATCNSAYGLFLALYFGILKVFGDHMGYHGSNSGQQALPSFTSIVYRAHRLL